MHTHTHSAIFPIQAINHTKQFVLLLCLDNHIWYLSWYHCSGINLELLRNGKSQDPLQLWVSLHFLRPHRWLTHVTVWEAMVWTTLTEAQAPPPPILHFCRVKKNSLPATKVQVFYSELTGKLIYKKKTAAILLVFLTLLEHNLLGSQWITIERMATKDKWDKIWLNINS